MFDIMLKDLIKQLRGEKIQKQIFKDTVSDQLLRRILELSNSFEIILRESILNKQHN